MPKIQIYAQDLAEILNIGEITNMVIVVKGNLQILRIEYTEKKEEYKTIKPGSKPKAKPRYTPEPPASMGEKILDSTKAWWNDPRRDVPPWERR